MSEKKDLMTELYNLYEKNVNEPNRKKVLDGMQSHPSGHILAQCVFQRADSSVFHSAQNQLLPKNGQENGAYDSLLAPAHCKSILRKFEYEDYVINLLKDEFERKNGRHPRSLSEIASIINEREKIKNGTAVAKFEATFEEEFFYPYQIRIGSEWIVSECTPIKELPKVSTYRRREEYIQEPYVYKICRSSGIQLEQLFLKSAHTRMDLIVLFEPFLIFTDNNDDEPSIVVYNLLEPNAAPMTVKRGPSMNIMYTVVSLYECDMRTYGKLPDKLPFLVVYEPTDTTLCFECLEIKTTAITTLWTRVIDLSEFGEFFCEIFWIDRDNYLLESREDVFQYHHVILSSAEITKYQHSLGLGIRRYLKSDLGNYTIFKEKLLMFREKLGGNVFLFTSTEQKHEMKPVCAFEDQDSAITDCFFYNEEIVCRKYDENEARFSISKLLDFIDDEIQEKKQLPRVDVPGSNVTVPLIDIFHLGEKQMIGKYGSIDVMGRSKIGCAWKDKIEIYI